MGWQFMEEFLKEEHHVCIEAEPGNNGLPSRYQVLYRPKWKVLLNDLSDKPTEDMIAVSLRTLGMGPKEMRAATKADVLHGFLMRLSDISKKKGYCIACDRLLLKNAEHDDECLLSRAIQFITKC